MMLSQNTNSQNFQVTLSPPITLSSPSSTPNNENAPPSDKKDLVICSERAVIARIEKPKVEFDHLIGLDPVKDALRRYLVMPSLILQRTQMPQSYGTKGVLLYGPPGGGKTSLVQACAHEMNSNFYVVQGKDFYTEIKNPLKFIKELFIAARENQPACIVLENLDGILSKNIQDTDNEVFRRTMTEFLVQMMNAYADPQIFVIGTSQEPWTFSPAVRRRFTLRLPVFPPDHSERTKLLTEKLAHVDNLLHAEEISKIVDFTEGYSYKNIVELIRLASYEPVRELQQAKYFKRIDTKNEEDQVYEACEPTDPEAKELSFVEIPYENIKPRKIIIEDFYKAFKRISASIEPIQMQQYQRFFDEWSYG